MGERVHREERVSAHDFRGLLATLLILGLFVFGPVLLSRYAARVRRERERQALEARRQQVQRMCDRTWE